MEKVVAPTLTGKGEPSKAFGGHCHMCWVRRELKVVWSVDLVYVNNKDRNIIVEMIARNYENLEQQGARSVARDNVWRRIMNLGRLETNWKFSALLRYVKIPTKNTQIFMLITQTITTLLKTSTVDWQCNYSRNKMIIFYTVVVITVS